MIKGFSEWLDNLVEDSLSHTSFSQDDSEELRNYLRILGYNLYYIRDYMIEKDAKNQTVKDLSKINYESLMFDCSYFFTNMINRMYESDDELIGDLVYIKMNGLPVITNTINEDKKKKLSAKLLALAAGVKRNYYRNKDIPCEGYVIKGDKEIDVYEMNWMQDYGIDVNFKNIYDYISKTIGYSDVDIFMQIVKDKIIEESQQSIEVLKEKYKRNYIKDMNFDFENTSKEDKKYKYIEYNFVDKFLHYFSCCFWIEQNLDIFIDNMDFVTHDKPFMLSLIIQYLSLVENPYIHLTNQEKIAMKEYRNNIMKLADA